MQLLLIPFICFGLVAGDGLRALIRPPAALSPSWLDVTVFVGLTCVIYGLIVASVRGARRTERPTIAGWSLRAWLIAPPLTFCTGLILGAFLPEIIALRPAAG